MKNLLSKLLIGSLILPAILLINPSPVYAGANFYLSPASKSVPQGTTLSIAVRVSSSDPIDSVLAVLSYPADKLDFLSINTSGSPFDLNLPPETHGGGGSVSIGSGHVGGAISGDKFIATVNFRAKVGSGTATISFTSSTLADNGGNPVPVGKSGGTYTFAPPPPLPPPPDTTAPKITDVKVTGTSFKGATIEWKTDEAASSIVEYGLNNKYGLSSESAGLTKDHKVSFSSEILIPGTSWHFRVKSADAAGNMVTGQDATFKTIGYTVKIKVVNQKGNVVKGAKVTLASETQTATSDKDGIALFKDVSPGKHQVTVTAGDIFKSDSIEVKEATDKEIAAGKVEAQIKEIKISTTNRQLLWVLAIVLAGLLGVLAGAGLVWWWAKRKGSSEKESFPVRPI